MIDAWLGSFKLDSEKAITDLFSGRAGLGSDLRLDIPELLYQEFPPLPRFEQQRKKLDRALLAWLNSMRLDFSNQVAKLTYAAYSKRLCDALISAQLLDLPEITLHIRETLDSWLRWMQPLRLAPERDPALECWRLIARHQDDRAHMPAWLQLAQDCREEYLSVALLGIQNLPNDGDATFNQIHMLLALMRHATKRFYAEREAHAFFKTRWAAIRGSYPRAPEHWRHVCAIATDIFEDHVESTSRVCKGFIDLLRTPLPDPMTKKKIPIMAKSADLDEIKRIFDDKKQSIEARVQKFFQVEVQNLKYAEAMGNGYFYVRTLSKYGTHLLKQKNLPPETMTRLGQMIELGLAWEPLNPYVWSLWADWHGQMQNLNQREWILREAVRLFPNNEPSRVELARLLIRRGEAHWGEAEIWLRKAADRNPNNKHSRVELARLLIRRGEAHWGEAESLLLKVAKRNREGPHAPYLLSVLFERQGKKDDATKILKEFLKKWGNNSIIQKRLDTLRARKTSDCMGESDDSYLDIDWDQNPILSTPASPDQKVLQINIQPEYETIETDTPQAEPQPLGFLESIQKGEVTTGASLSPDIVRKKDTSSPMDKIMLGIRRRADIQTEFMHALFATSEDTRSNARQMLSDSARQSNVVAGLFQQWIDENSDIEPLPHAWAWQSCRLYQKGTDTEWTQLERNCPEKRLYTDFMHRLATDHPEEGLLERIDQHKRRSEPEIGRTEGKETRPPLETYIFSTHEQFKLNQPTKEQRDSAALAVCSALAEDAPQFYYTVPVFIKSN